MLPDGKGFEVIQQASFKDYEVIFTTSFDEYAIIAFEFSALHYLLKPIEIEHCIEAVDRFLEKYNNKKYLVERIENINNNSFQLPEKIVMPTEKGLVFYDIMSIVKIESDRNYSKIYFEDGNSKLFTKHLNVFDSVLNDLPFVRINRSHIINLKYISQVHRSKRNSILLIDDSEYSISDSQKNEFFEKLEKFAKVIK
jgi:two-component system LytT family response regulator